MPETRDLIRRVMIAVNRIDGAYYRFSKDLGLKSNTLDLLYALDDGRFHSQKQICEEWLIPKTTLNTIIKECEAFGYVVLQAVPGQKRERRICLTPSGRALAREKLAELYAAESEAMSDTLQGHDPAFVAALESFSDSLRVSFETRSKSSKCKE